MQELFATLGITAQKIMPVMTHQFLAHFADETQAARAKDVLSRLMLDGRPVFGIDPSEPGTLYFGNQVHTLVEPGSRIMTSSNSDPSFDYYEVFYRINEMKSGRHHPDGCLWIRNGKQRPPSGEGLDIRHSADHPGDVRPADLCISRVRPLLTSSRP